MPSSPDRGSTPSRGSGSKSGNKSPSSVPSLGSPTFFNDLLLSSVINAKELPGVGAVVAGKESLSLQSTTIKFRKFVQKAGPVFWIQDAVEAILAWEDPVQTVFWGAVYALVCLYPMLIFLIPNIALISILLVTYFKRFPPAPPTEDASHLEARIANPPPVPVQPAEGSVDYLSNMQNIQVMMGRIGEVTDLGRLAVPYLNWSNERLSMVILQLAVVSGVFMSIGMWYIPWRFVFLAAGEGAIFAGHPLSQSLIREALPYAMQQRHKTLAHLKRVMDDDALMDHHLQADEFREVEIFETERLINGRWGAHSLAARESEEDSQALLLDAASPHHPDHPIVEGISLRPPYGLDWVTGEDWEKDLTSNWSEFGTDNDGWTYTEQRPEGPHKSTDELVQVRRRRWTRRAVRIAQ